jgi:hypothetical protein
MVYLAIKIGETLTLENPAYYFFICIRTFDKNCDYLDSINGLDDC